MHSLIKSPTTPDPSVRKGEPTFGPFGARIEDGKGACEQPKQMHEPYGYYEDVDVTAPQLLSTDGW